MRWALALLLLAGCGAEAVEVDPVEAQVDAWLAALTLEEKIAMKGGASLASNEGIYDAGGNERLGIVPYRMVDGPRGVRSTYATAFPVGMARGATWDVELERRVGEAIGLEARAKGANVILAPVVNVLRHPGWGRAQETYGEDPEHLGALGVAFVEGAQRHVLASVKHFALNSIENNRFEVDVRVDDRALREVYLPAFRRVVEADVASVMSAYNKVNGAYCSENEALLSTILKGEWGFDGWVESDWVLGTHSTIESANAGLDIEMPFATFFGDDLRTAVRRGFVKEATIDASVRRILRKHAEFALSSPAPVDVRVVESEAHRALAREAANKSIVLLKNEVLPLAGNERIAMLGALADVENLGDNGSSAVFPTSVTTPYEGLAARADVTLVTTASAAAGFDVAVVVVGLDAEDEGELIPPNRGGDRTSLALDPADVELVRATAAVVPTIVVLEGGSAITLEWIDDVAAVLMAWYPGMEGGHAIADVLLGDVNPSGRLPTVVPVRAEDLVPFDPAADEVTYDLFHGQRHLDRQGIEAHFPLGFGLGYTTFAYTNLRIEGREVSFDVTNTGERAGIETAQLYVSFEGSSVERPERLLAGFARVELEPGEMAQVRLRVEDRHLAYYDDGWIVEAIDYGVHVGRDAATFELAGTLSP
ncbi:MAG: glycoside hydrolase family 3 C-terminal domain-containing protein [Deltaproteobacteria bacterium]|jgi:beta-glucosidase